MVQGTTDQFMNRKRWSGIDTKKLERAIRAFNPDKESLEQYLKTLQNEQFPSRSLESVRTKFEEMAIQQGVRLDPSTDTRSAVASRFDSRWTKDEMDILSDFAQEYDPAKKTISEYGREIAEFFKERHSEMAVIQRITLMTREKRAAAAADGTAVVRARQSKEPKAEAETRLAPAPVVTPPAPAEVRRTPPPSTSTALAVIPTEHVPVAPPPDIRLPSRLKNSGLQRNVVYEARISGVADYGVFVSFKLTGEILPVSGLVHFSEIWDDNNYRSPHDYFDVDEPVRVCWLETGLKGNKFSMLKANFKPEKKKNRPTISAIPMTSHEEHEPVETVVQTQPPKQHQLSFVSPPTATAAAASVEDLVKRMDSDLRNVLSTFADLRSGLRKPGNTEALEAAWGAIDDALQAIDTLDIRRAQMVLALYRTNFMPKQEEK